MAIRIGSKVRYKHGRGMSEGTVLSTMNGQALIRTKNGASTYRPITAIQSARSTGLRVFSAN